ITGPVLGRSEFFELFLLLAPWQVDPNDGAAGDLKLCGDVPQHQRVADRRLWRTGFVNGGIFDLAVVKDLGNEAPDVGMHAPLLGDHSNLRPNGCFGGYLRFGVYGSQGLEKLLESLEPTVDVLLEEAFLRCGFLIAPTLYPFHIEEGTIRQVVEMFNYLIENLDAALEVIK